MPVPTAPKLYHIVHLDNLASIVGDGCLWADAVMVQRTGGTTIGMSEIKQRRLRLPVTAHLNLAVGNCVPFYFCSRSIMLYVIHRANHAGLTYRGGQQPIVHLEVDLHRAVAWAETTGHRWAISLSNAGARYAEFRTEVSDLSALNWAAIQARDFSQPEVKEAKQAEFLIEQKLPWDLVERIGVYSPAIVQSVSDAIAGAAHRPRIETRKDWYY